jgi:hypothetical protein
MHISFSLLRIKGLYMFRALRAYLQEALQCTDITRMQYTKRHLCSRLQINKQCSKDVEAFDSNCKLNEKCITSVSSY